MNGDGEPFVARKPTERLKMKGQVADCTWSLAQAMQAAGGGINDGILDMSLREFIVTVAGRNGIRFTYQKPSRSVRE